MGVAIVTGMRLQGFRPFCFWKVLYFLVPACSHHQDLCAAFWVVIDSSLPDSEPQVSSVSATRDKMNSSDKRTAAMCIPHPRSPSDPATPEEALDGPHIIDKEIET